MEENNNLRDSVARGHAEHVESSPKESDSDNTAAPSQSCSSERIVNSSAYKFCKFQPEELPALRDKLLSKGKSYGKSNLRGTVLITAEGVNIRLSGKQSCCLKYQKDICDADLRLAGIEFKDSYSDELTLPRMLVKIKKEVISMGVEHVQPAEHGLLDHLSPEEFKKWMDENKDMVVLDTRNDYEIRLGTFKNAVDLNIKSFRAFPEQAKNQLCDVPKEKPVVMFCTGGVRCEKASYCLKNDGFKNVYQLDGGILKYFEKVGGEHYDGSCYIFDNRVALTPKLEAAGVKMCFKCRSPLTNEEMELESFKENESCVYCVDGKSDFRAVAVAVASKKRKQPDECDRSTDTD